MPAVTAFVGSFFADQIADEVEREHYPADAPGKALPLWRAIVEGGKTALLAVLVYLIATPFLLFAGFGAVIFFLATAWLLSREYFELAAMRFRPPEEAKALRKRNAARVFIAGLFIAAFVSIPVVNLATPLFAMALMVHLHKRLGGPRLVASRPFRWRTDGRAALADDPQSPQQLVDIDGPADADALGREQAVIVGIPHAFVPVLPVPIDGHAHPGPLRNFIRVSLQIAHDDAPANALIAR